MEETPWGFPDIPPGSGQAAERERNQVVREAVKYPPAERPMFSALPEPPMRETGPREPKSGSALSVTGLVVGLIAVFLAGVFFYRATVNIRGAENRANQALSAVEELRHTGGGPTPAAVKIEIMRTLRILDSMAVEFGSEPEVLRKVETMRNEALDILYSLEEKAASDQSVPPVNPAPGSGALPPQADRQGIVQPASKQ